MDKRKEEINEISSNNSIRPKGILHGVQESTESLNFKERLKDHLKTSFEQHRLAFTAVFI